jgi:ATP phosphoribosyltransferase regulatory subunit
MSVVDPRIAFATPTGTRDVLPEELRELRGITRAIEDCFAEAGYGEVRTPTLEYETTENAGLAAYRLIDERGDTLVLRSDMTVPIARVALNRYASETDVLRFSYLERSWRRVKPHSGEGREILQAGAELIGAGKVGNAEIVQLCASALGASGLNDWRLAVGDAGILESVLADLDPAIGHELREAVIDQDLVRVDAIAAERGLASIAKLVRYRRPATDFESTWEDSGATREAVAGLLELLAVLPPEIKSRVIVDLGLSSTLNYYSGFVFAVYDPAVGRSLGGGGSYDGLFAAAGSELTGVGFALDIDLLHQAIAGEDRGESLPNG